MKRNNILNNGIPISVSLNPTLEAENFRPIKEENKKRLLTISSIAFVIAIAASLVARLLIYLIDFFTNIFFRGNFSAENFNPADNILGPFVILIPVIGGIIVGLMAFYGSKAIRGHGIPEAMEQILTNESKIKPAITYLKPLSSAISIGTGGPFGAEGPIIATGGALGSTIGQLLKISSNERKILLAAGATAGMSAIFGSPVAAMFLAVELLLFEFSPRSLIPVSIACIVGAAGHHLLFDVGPFFAMPDVAFPDTTALAIYGALGIAIGILAAGVSKAIYFIEDVFEKLPIHWMWWPAIGGLAGGVVGFFAPHTLGVGYDNISGVLSGNLPLKIIFSLCVLKFISWAIALGSGTSGGTLAPLLTIGGAAGSLLGFCVLHLFPEAGITLPLSALVGMSAMFAGASRALLTSIVFALETTGQSNTLVPVLCACVASYVISFFFMQNTIMTEKIARRGVNAPHSYEQDLLEKIKVEQVMNQDEIVLSEENSIREIHHWLNKEKEEGFTVSNYFIIASKDGEYLGILSLQQILHSNLPAQKSVAELLSGKSSLVSVNANLRAAVEIMAAEDAEVLPVIANGEKNIVGIISYRDIISAYRHDMESKEKKLKHISLKRGGLKILIRGQKFFSSIKI